MVFCKELLFAVIPEGQFPFQLWDGSARGAMRVVIRVGHKCKYFVIKRFGDFLEARCKVLRDIRDEGGFQYSLEVPGDWLGHHSGVLLEVFEEGDQRVRDIILTFQGYGC